MSKSLERLSAEPTLFAIEDSVKRLTNAYDIQPPKVIDFDTKTRISNWVDGSAADWTFDLPNMDSYDIVISDNLIDILKVRNDAWLSGSFFWHKALIGCSTEISQISEELLLKNKPRMVTSSMFSSSYLKNNTMQYEVGLFGQLSQISTNEIRRNSALISCGQGSDESVVRLVSEFIERIVHYDNVPFEFVWVDPIVFPRHKIPGWMKMADYTTDMYKSISAAIIRPGIGTVTDSLTFGARLFMYYELNNLEMLENAKKIESLNLGEIFYDIENAWISSMEYICDDSLKFDHENNLKSIEVNGADQAARIILNEY